MTADSYIVFFERLKDEVRAGRSPRTAVQPAFQRAFKTIVAADIVTGIAAAVLYFTAVSSVRGFALTLGVATALDLEEGLSLLDLTTKKHGRNSGTLAR